MLGVLGALGGYVTVTMFCGRQKYGDVMTIFKRTVATGAALALLALSSTGVLVAQQRTARAAKSPTLTAADYLEIKQLVARYSYALDEVSGNGEAFARLFTSDGVFKVKGSSESEVKGRQKLAAFARGDIKNQGPLWVHDFVTNHIIQPSPQGATGSVYVVGIEIAESGNPGVIQTGGRYEDVYEKTSEGWRIKARTLVPIKLGPKP